MYLLIVLLLLLGEIGVPSDSSLAFAANTDYTYEKESNTRIKIGKCCELNELLKDDKCIPLNETEETQVWRPESLYDDNHFRRSNQHKGNYFFKFNSINLLEF